MSSYERMERMARGELPHRSPFLQRALEVFFIVASMLLLGYLLYAAQFSGTLRWFLGFAVIAVVSLYAWYTVAARTEELAPMVPRAPRPSVRFGELAVFTAMVRRANQGLPYSQTAVASRAREAFEERARLARGLTPDEMRGLERDEEGLQAALRDAALADFMYLPASEEDARQRWVRAARSRDGFTTSFGRILGRMEAWR